jgi:hypothetical protein
MAAPQGMLLDAVFGSEAIDSSGEILHVDGADLSNLEAGLGQINYEHNSGDDEEEEKDHDAPRGGDCWVGRIVYVKKIFNEKDCDNDRQLKFWHELELPFIYGIVRLYDAAGHKNAQALAAIIRDHAANGEKIIWRWSVEGSTLKTSPDKKELLQTLIHNVALTRKPCNRTAETGILSDPQAPEGFDKEPVKIEKDFLDDVLKRSEQHFHPNATPLGAYTYIDYNPEIKVDLDTAVKKMESLTKAITGGNYNVAPGALSGGAALQREDRMMVRKWAQGARKALTKWDGESDLKEHLKHELPEASEAFIERFKGLVDKYQVGKKSSLLKLGNLATVEKREELVRKFEAMTIELKKAAKQMVQGQEQEPAAPPQQQSPGLVRFKGKTVKPGRVQLADGSDVALLHADQNHLYTVPHEKLGGWSHEDLKKYPRRDENDEHYIHTFPEDVDEPNKIDDRHITHYNDEKQKSIVRGIDFSQVEREAVSGKHAMESHWQKGAHGSHVYVKRTDSQSDFPQPRKEVVFHNLARDFFGMGDHVPTTAHVLHPQTGEEVAVVDGVLGRHVPRKTMNDVSVPSRHEDAEAIHSAGENGDLGKMAIMDAMMGNMDRHQHNWMLDSKGKIKLIDHGDAFRWSGNTPDYLTQYQRVKSARTGMPAELEPIHPAARRWAEKLDPNKLQTLMKNQMVPQRHIDATVKKLLGLKAALAQNPNLDHHAAMIAMGG